MGGLVHFLEKTAELWLNKYIVVKIKDLPEQERPREKMLKCGPDKLTDEELLALVSGLKTRCLVYFSIFLFFIGLFYSNGIGSITKVNALMAPGHCCFVEVKITDTQKDEDDKLSFGFVIQKEVGFDKFLKHSVYNYTKKDFGLCMFPGLECPVSKGEVYENQTISHRKDRYWMLESISAGDRMILLAGEYCGMDFPCGIGFGPAAPIKSEPKGMTFWLMSGSITVLLLGAGVYVIRRPSFKNRS